MSKIITLVLCLSSLLAAFLLFLATSDISKNLSPQGCRMSYMLPSYVLQPEFNASWTPLASRYSLWLYREVGWDPVEPAGQPVLFIPGNAGSSHQVRSIASSATRQYFSSPFAVASEFQSRSKKPLDVFAVEFNEDFSAFHGTTLESQISYASATITYILSRYPQGTDIIVMGHSMGGIVAMSLLPSDKISAIITMSTPHTLPPARFDSRIDILYSKLQEILENDPTPIVSICGGATDMMIPSESCVLPKTKRSVFRRTVFTSALEGAWTGVGHREMVWCHQVRWRVARTALELGGETGLSSRATTLDKWLRDGHSLPPKSPEYDRQWHTGSENSVLLSLNEKLVLRNPSDSRVYYLPVSDYEDTASQRVTVLVFRGTIGTVSPQHPIPLRVTIATCIGPSPTAAQCMLLPPEKLRLVPNPLPGKTFPIPHEGSDESEGVVLFESYIPKIDNQQWVAVQIDNANGEGWVVAQLSSNQPIVVKASTFSLLSGVLSVSVPEPASLSTSFTFPNLLSNALVVYRLIPPRDLPSSCTDSLLPPLLMHTSHPEETHYFPVARKSDDQILLHTHLPAPFIDHTQHFPSSLNFTVYTSGELECKKDFNEFQISIDWSATLARWASRYLTSVVSWGSGVVAVIIFLAQSKQGEGAAMLNIGDSMTFYSSLLFRYFLPGSFILSFLPFPESMYLGNNGILFLSPIAPLVLFVSSGFVFMIWWILTLLLYIVGKINIMTGSSRAEKASAHRTTVLSLVIVCAIIFLFVPWQIAFVGCWLLHLHTCASSLRLNNSTLDRHKNDAVPLVERAGWREIRETSNEDLDFARSSGRRVSDLIQIKRENLNYNMHLLLFMTWLLPLTAPVLAVWVRTLLTAGYTTPFDGDHNFIAVLPFLVLTDYASWTPGRLFDKTRLESRLSFRWFFAVIAGTAFLFGSRRPYSVLDVSRVVVWILVLLKIGRRYFGGLPWKI